MQATLMFLVDRLVTVPTLRRIQTSSSAKDERELVR